MDVVYDLWFEREYADREDTELHIGIYANEADAKAAIATLIGQPGFRDHPEGFNIYRVTLGRTGWRGGFVSEIVPARERDVVDLPAARISKRSFGE